MNRTSMDRNDRPTAMKRWRNPSTPQTLSRAWVRARQATTAVLMLLAASSAAAEQYEFSTGPDTRTWPDRAWSGDRAFLDVYCVQFPDPGAIGSTSEGLLKGNGISYFRAVYNSGVAAHIVTSTIPRGRSETEEFAMLLDREQNNAAATASASSADRYQVRSGKSAWGPVIQLRLANVAQSPPDGPFPITRTLFASDDAPYTRSSHRLFVKGSNRFEVAVLGVPKTQTEADLPELEQRLEKLADRLMSSLQNCKIKTSGAP